MAPPNPKVVRAFNAMRDIGIPEEKVKPVLKKLLKLYDKNWELIEEENYRVLADAIFDAEDTKVVEQKKSQKVDVEDFEQEALTHDELGRPQKRLRLRGQEGPSSSSHNNNPRVAENSFIKPKEEEDEMPSTYMDPQPQILKSTFGNARTELQPGFSQIVSPLPVSPRPVSPLNHPTNKGKQHVSPSPLPVHENYNSAQQNPADRNQPCSRKGAESRKAIHDSERDSDQAHAKDPTNGPSTIPLRQQKVPDYVFVTPKDEPFADGMIDFEVPIAVIYPDSSNQVDSSAGKAPIGNPNGQESAFPSVETENRGNGLQSSVNKRPTNCELTTIPVESSSLEIASSPLGEVKISISCNPALRGSNIHVPSLDELREYMEEKCLQSYKVSDPNFSVVKLMKEMCKCFLDLTTNSAHASQESVMNITPEVDLQRKAAAQDVLAVGGNRANIHLSSSASNGSVALQCPGGVDELQIPKPFSAVGGKDDTNESNATAACAKSDNGVTEDPKLSNSRTLHDSNDITKGEERVKIPWVNGINDDCPPPFYYIPQNLVYENASVNFTLSQIKDENCCANCFGDCLSSATPCACACKITGEFTYTLEGLVKEALLEQCISMTRDPRHQCLLNCKECPIEKSKKEAILETCKGHLKRKVIKECWSKCGCSRKCGNRVVQRGINYKLQVFYTPDGKGWGLRALEKLPKGAFVCEFVGEITTITELDKRTSEKHTYPVILDASWGLEEVIKEDKALCLDATHYGNVARFINHRCLDANLIEIPVQVETPEQHYYHIAFFTAREVDIEEELTWDYGINFDDHDHPIKAFKCLCGSKFCRSMKRANKSKYVVNGR